MHAARDEVLARVREALAAGDAAGDERLAPPPFTGAAARGPAADGLVELLRTRLLDYKAEVRLVALGAVAGALDEVCAAQAVRRMAVPAGLPLDWRPAAAAVVADHGLSPAQLAALDGAVTGCTLALAETGTLVLAAGPAEGRRALTLVPDLHICIVETRRVVADLHAAMPELVRLVREERRPLTFVSGPSATSDIELQRVEGVHGPRRLVVLIASG